MKQFEKMFSQSGKNKKSKRKGGKRKKATNSTIPGMKKSEMQ